MGILRGTKVGDTTSTKLMAMMSAVLLAICAVGCLSKTGPVVAKRECCAPLAQVVGMVARTNSVFDGKAEWVDADSKLLTLGSLEGRPVVMAFFFTSCELTCPVTVERLKWIENSLSESERQKVRFVLVSIDPERDTPAKLAAYRQCHRLNSERWTLLRSSPDTTTKLASQLGIAYRNDAFGGVRHSNQISLLNSHGYLVEQQVGIQEGTDRIAASLHRLIRAGAIETASR